MNIYLNRKLVQECSPSHAGILWPKTCVVVLKQTNKKNQLHQTQIIHLFKLINLAEHSASHFWFVDHV